MGHIRLYNSTVRTSFVKAKHLLERVAKEVQPVMRKHSWTVPLLSELSAKNGRLWVGDLDFTEEGRFNESSCLVHQHAVTAMLGVLSTAIIKAGGKVSLYCLFTVTGPQYRRW